MQLATYGKQVQRVLIFDDDPSARKSMAFNVTDAKLQPIDDPGPLPALEQFVSRVMKSADAAICDHRLGLIGKYAGFDGAEAVAKLYTSKFPAVLCTNFSKADLDTIRRYRRQIPSLIRTDEIDPDKIVEGFERCLNEFDGKFSSSRNPWRTLIRVEDVDTKSVPHMIYVVIPGWSSTERIRLPLDLIPSKFHAQIKPGTRFHAQVNIGTENQDDLYFDSFEFD